MSSGDNQSAPGTVDPSLHQTSPAAPEEVHELIYDFWQSDPTEVWKTYIEATDQALAAGEPVVMVSAMHGSGKSQQLFASLRNERAEDDVWSIDQLPATRSIESDTFTAGTRRGKAKLWLIDEDTAKSKEEAQIVATSISNGVVAGKQFVVAIPAPNQQTRSDIVQLTTKALEERGIEPTYLGDITNVHITAQRTTQLLNQLGFRQEVVTLFEELEPLRAPRLFGGFLNALANKPDDNPGEVGKQDIEMMLKSLILGTRNSDDKFTRAADTIAGNIVEIPLSLRPNVPFLASCLTTADCVKLYEALDEPLPTEAGFPTQEWYEYAFHKD
jgi:hypothetical protein